MRLFASKAAYLLACVLSIGVLSVVFVPTTAYAADGDSCDSSFLGFPAWYNGLAVSSGDGCDITSPTEVGGVGTFIWIIVFNVVEMILRAAGYAAVAFIIYGGYRYMTSAGSADGVAAAKKTITNAVIGLVLSIAAVAIVNTISRGLGV